MPTRQGGTTGRVEHLARRSFFVTTGCAMRVDAVNLEDGLGEIEADRGNLHGGWLLCWGCFDNDHPMAHRRRTQGPSTPSVLCEPLWLDIHPAKASLQETKAHALDGKLCCCTQPEKRQHPSALPRIPDRMPAILSLCIVQHRRSRHTTQRHQAQIPIANRTTPRGSYMCETFVRLPAPETLRRSGLSAKCPKTGSFDADCCARESCRSSTRLAG